VTVEVTRIGRNYDGVAGWVELTSVERWWLRPRSPDGGNSSGLMLVSVLIGELYWDSSLHLTLPYTLVEQGDATRFSNHQF
jgi:hypothetical protein